MDIRWWKYGCPSSLDNNIRFGQLNMHVANGKAALSGIKMCGLVKDKFNFVFLPIRRFCVRYGLPGSHCANNTRKKKAMRPRMQVLQSRWHEKSEKYYCLLFHEGGRLVFSWFHRHLYLEVRYLCIRNETRSDVYVRWLWQTNVYIAGLHFSSHM